LLAKKQTSNFDEPKAYLRLLIRKTRDRTSIARESTWARAREKKASKFHFPNNKTGKIENAMEEAMMLITVKNKKTIF
jgi:hypothetical protein